MTAPHARVDAGFLADARRQLQPVADEYKLRLADVDNGAVALVGRGFGVVVQDNFDDVRVVYLQSDRKRGVVAHDITPWLRGRLTPQDRALFDSPTGRAAYRSAALRVVVSGFMHGLADVLRGDDGWLVDLQRRDPAAWAGEDAIRFEPVNALVRAD